MVNFLSPVFLRLRTSSRLTKPLSLNISSVYGLRLEIEMRRRVLRDIRVIQTRLRSIMYAPVHGIHFAAYRRSKSRRELKDPLSGPGGSARRRIGKNPLSSCDPEAV